jgi:hypothetical protein
MRSAAGADPCGPNTAHIDLGVEGPCFVGAGEGPPGKSPRTPSVVFERASRNLHALIPWSLVDSHEPGAPFRPLSIRAPRQAGLRTSFRLAPSGYRPTLRSTDREDARCDAPTSAIQSNHVHPHLARSRLRALLAKRGHPAESWAPRSGIPGDQAFSRRRDRFGGSSHDTWTVHPCAFRFECSSVGVVFPRSRVRPSL